MGGTPGISVWFGVLTVYQNTTGKKKKKDKRGKWGFCFSGVFTARQGGTPKDKWGGPGETGNKRGGGAAIERCGRRGERTGGGGGNTRGGVLLGIFAGGFSRERVWISCKKGQSWRAIIIGKKLRPKTFPPSSPGCQREKNGVEKEKGKKTGAPRKDEGAKKGKVLEKGRKDRILGLGGGKKNFRRAAPKKKKYLHSRLKKKAVLHPGGKTELARIVKNRGGKREKTSSKVSKAFPNPGTPGNSPPAGALEGWGGNSPPGWARAFLRGKRGAPKKNRACSCPP